MAIIERNYIVPLRKEWRKGPRHKRSKKAITALRSFLIRHMKVKDVKIGKELNDHIFARGYKNPPHKVHITASKEDDIVKVNIFGVKYKDFKPIKEEKKEGVVDKLKSKIRGKEV